VSFEAPARRVPILVYHSVCEEPAPLLRDWAVTPFQFREHLQRIGDAGYATLTVTDYVDRLATGAELPDRFVVITFDDGFADFERHAAPALSDAGMTATMYVSTAYVGGRSTWLGPDGEQPMLTWDAIRDLDANGFEMGPHSHHHWALDELDLAQAADEITRSKLVLEDELGHETPSFAYPHGYHTRRIQDVLRVNGFRSACGVKHASSSTDDDIFGLARIIVPPESSGGDLLALIDDLPCAPSRPKFRTGAWRMVRRARARRSSLPDPVHEHPS
jgi:peptidoglycan/xylan/chitin deacetylase (PgdA/CDA1 family)